MGKDDYFVIVYKVLSYLYKCLKNGDLPQASYLTYQTKDFPIGYSYWCYVIENMVKDGYIENVSIVPIDGTNPIIKILPDVRITPKGIEYLQENNMMKKAAGVVKEIILGLNTIH